MKKLMTRTGKLWDVAMQHAEAGMSVGAELVTLCPIEGRDEGYWRIFWRVRDDSHIDEVDAAISTLYPDEDDE